MEEERKVKEGKKEIMKLQPYSVLHVL